MPLMLHAQESSFQKSPVYDIMEPHAGLNATRNKLLHDKRRRIWIPAFASKALEIYEVRIKTHVTLLEECLARYGESPVDVTEVFAWFGFDVMGDLAFGRSFDMLREGGWIDAIAIIRKGMSMLGPIIPVPWLAKLGLGLPTLQTTKDWRKMTAWALQLLSARIQVSIAAA